MSTLEQSELNHKRLDAITKRLGVALLLTSIVGLGCAHKMAEQRQNAMNSWVGSHISEYIQVNGAYSYTASDGQDGSIYVWEKRFYIPTRPASPPRTGGGALSGALTGISNALRAKAKQRNAMPLVIQMFTRPNGLIYSWHVDGLQRDTELPVKPNRYTTAEADTSYPWEDAPAELVHLPETTVVYTCATSNKYHLDKSCKYLTLPIRESIVRIVMAIGYRLCPDCKEVHNAKTTQG